ncbi:MAG: DUF456 domain-containing protein [bacterium]|nr:DUF456 domain-containing protein [bacterium]
MNELIYLTIFSILILAGVISFVLLVFPSHVFILIITLVFGFVDHWVHLKIWELLVLAGLAGIMIFVDYFSGLLGAKFFGASSKSLLWGVVGLFLGIFFWPPIGSLIGLFIGVFIAETYYFKKIKSAVRAASGSLIGVVLGLIINIILGLGFLGLFIWFGLK